MNSIKKPGYVLVFFLLLAGLSLHAQHKPFQFGFKGAVNIGWLKSDVDRYENDGARIGGSWGFVADFFLVENYSITTGFEVLYLNANGQTYAGNMVGDTIFYSGTINEKIKSKYIQLPIIFTMKTNPIKEKFRIYGQIGYGLGFLLSAKKDYSFVSDDGSYSELSNNDSYDGYSLTRSAVILGAGVELPLYKSTFLRTGFNFNNCFIDIAKSDNVSLRNNFVEFSAAVIF